MVCSSLGQLVPFGRVVMFKVVIVLFKRGESVVGNVPKTVTSGVIKI